MRSMRKTVEIKAPAQRVYEFITQPANWPSIWPSMVEVSNISVQPNGAHEFDWTYKMAGVHFKGHAKTEDVQPGKLVRTRNHAGIPSLFTWTLEGHNGGSTKLTCDVEYTVPAPVVGKIAEALVVKLNEREMETLLANLKEVVESSAGATVAAQPRH